MNRFYRFCIGLILLGALSFSGCQASSENMTTRVVVEIASGVEATLTAQPTPTGYATALAIATQPPLVTATSLPTGTPQVTQKAPGTATPYPTQTAWPTFAPTPTPTPSNTPLPIIPAAPAPLAGAQLEDQLLAALNTTFANARYFKSQASGSDIPNCTAIIDTFNHVVNSPTFDVSGASSEAQYAYTVYREAIKIFSGDSDELWTDGVYAAYTACVNNGDSTAFNSTQISNMFLTVGQVEGLLIDGIERLGGEP